MPLVNKLTASGLLRVFEYPKFKLTKAGQSLLLADFLPYAEIIAIHDEPIDLAIIRGPADQMFLSLAIVGKADVLVSGHNDLLVLKNSFNAIPIMTIHEFESWLQ